MGKEESVGALLYFKLGLGVELGESYRMEGKGDGLRRDGEA